MWYPGISNFAETSCIAAIEAQACGTPFVGSLKGALPETARPSYEAGLLIPGVAESDAEYQKASIETVLRIMDQCGRNSVTYRELQKEGREHVKNYTYDALAQDWERQVDGWFTERYEGNKIGVLRALMHEEDRTAAKMVAEGILEQRAPRTDGDSIRVVDASNGPHDPAVLEAFNARSECVNIIAGRTCGPTEYATHALADSVAEADISGRFKDVSTYFANRKRLLDVACGNGAGAIRFAVDHPELIVVGVDYSEENIARAREGAERAGVADRCMFVCHGIWDFELNRPIWSLSCRDGFAEKFDAMFVGEFVEHVADCTALVDWLETFCDEGAQVVYTCPVGPFIELAPRDMPRLYTHVHHFRHDDVRAVWGDKFQCGAGFISTGYTVRNQPVGHWAIHYTVAKDRPAGTRDYATRITRTRPMPKLSVGIIAKNAEKDIARCLDSVWGIADEIVIGDTGSTDSTKAVAEDFGAKVISLPDVMQDREGFAGVRNKLLHSCSGDWFLWIDTDEVLTYSHKIRRYLDSSIFLGFVLHQHHLMIDAMPHYDRPVRLFKTGAGIQFYGCVHEQPQLGHCNGEIHPSLEVSSSDHAQNMPLIAHTGYLTESVRRHKMRSRNLPLLVRDQNVFPDRELGKVLVLRDYVTLSDEEVATHGYVTEKAQSGYAQAARIFMDRFDDPANKYHHIARPFYESALRRIGNGIEIEIAIAGKAGKGLQHAHAKPERIWVRDMDEYERYLAWKVKETAKPMRDVPYKTDPLLAPEAVTV
jgi:glycosyltransferase involved in cell wall biosynthesis